MVGLDHPLAFPCTRAYTSMKRDSENVTNPIQSMRRAVGSRESSTLARQISTAMTPSGRLTKKIQRQPMPLVMAPPTKGPTATAPPTTAP